MNKLTDIYMQSLLSSLRGRRRHCCWEVLLLVGVYVYDGCCTKPIYAVSSLLFVFLLLNIISANFLFILLMNSFIYYLFLSGFVKNPQKIAEVYIHIHIHYYYTPPQLVGAEEENPLWIFKVNKWKKYYFVLFINLFILKLLFVSYKTEFQNFYTLITLKPTYAKT